MAGSSLRGSSRRYATEEAVDLLYSLEDGALLVAWLLMDVDSDNGDIQELDIYLAEGDSGLLVLLESKLLVSVHFKLFIDKLVLRYSLLNSTKDLVSLELSEQFGPMDSMKLLSQ